MALPSWEAADRSHKNHWTLSLRASLSARRAVSMSRCPRAHDCVPDCILFIVFLFSLAEVGETSTMPIQCPRARHSVETKWRDIVVTQGQECRHTQMEEQLGSCSGSIPDFANLLGRVSLAGTISGSLECDDMDQHAKPHSPLKYELS